MFLFQRDQTQLRLKYVQGDILQKGHRITGYKSENIMNCHNKHSFPFIPVTKP